MAVNGEQNQQFNQNADDKEQAPNTGGGAANNPGGAAAPAAGSRVATSSNGQQAGSTGSGRFTNLQKYIGANQGAGDRLGAGITNKVSRENEGASKEANTSASAVRDGISSAKEKLQTGNQYKQGLEQDNLDIDGIAADQNKLQDFTQYRTGSAIDEAQLAKQNQAAQTNAMNYQSQLQNQLQQTQNDNGRYNMLKNTFGGGSVYQNPYSQGQQRLDGLFLQSGGQNGIGQLQNQIRTGLTGANSLVGELQGGIQKDVNNVTTQEQEIANALQNGMSNKTTGFVNGVNANESMINAQRAADQGYVADQYKALQGNGEIDQKFADMLGLSNGQHLYNTLSDKNVNSLFDYGQAELHGADQLATQQERSKYDALAKLTGIDPNAYAIRGDTQVSQAVTNKNVLQPYLNESQTGWNNFVNGANYEGRGNNVQGMGGAYSPFESNGTSTVGAYGNASKSAIAGALEALGPNATPAAIQNYLNVGGGNISIDSSHAFGSADASRAASSEAYRQAVASLSGQATNDFNAQGFFNRARIKS